MTWYPECAATSEDDGPNWTPPTIGNLMGDQQVKLTRLREAEAKQLVAREAKLFHERKALKYGVNTNRGMAHFKASMGYGNTREADGRLQEMFAQGGDPSAELPPKAVMKASKAAMQFHQKQAEKHGLNTPVGQAHVAAMQHHQAIHGKAKDQHQQMQQMKAQQQATQPRSPKVVKPPTQGQPQQQPMMASSEGGPGSGRHGGGAPGTSGSHKDNLMHLIDKHETLSKHSADPKERERHGRIAARLNDTFKKSGYDREAAPGHVGKKSPVPVPSKANQPSEDIRQNKPPIGLDPQDANKPGALSKLRQNETAGAHAGMIRAGGPGSGRRPGTVATGHGFKFKGKSFDRKYSTYEHPDGRSIITHKSGEWHSYSPNKGQLSAGRDGESLDKHLSGKKESMESRIRNFAREGGRGPYDNQKCTLPSKVKDQMKQNIVFRGKRTDERNKRESRRSL